MVGGVFTLTSGRLTTIVDSDAAGLFMDDQLIPGLGASHEEVQEAGEAKAR